MSENAQGTMTPCDICGSTHFLATRCEIYNAEVNNDQFLEFLKLRDVIYEISCRECDHSFTRGPDETLTQDFDD